MDPFDRFFLVGLFVFSFLSFFFFKFCLYHYVDVSLFTTLTDILGGFKSFPVSCKVEKLGLV